MDCGKRLFFFDIDGTLYDPAQKALPGSAKEALRGLFAAGHRVYIATSRGEYEMANVRAALAEFPFRGFIYSGGAVTRRAGRVVDARYLEADDAEKLMDYCGRNGILTRWQAAEGFYFSSEPGGAVRALLQDLFGEAPGVRTWNGERLLRLLVYARGAQAEELRALAARASILPLSPLVTDVMRAGVTKGTAMLREAERVGVPVSRVVAFGDNDNDCDMLAKAGTGVAMGNGSEGVKECADYVTAPVSEDGVYRACKHFGWI